ncbi:hypothetical protein PR048_006772 [Dryococelus australis]|uniref:Uncharacterized protein n=1 Tax=Dryococelus australis TaxID=614101 RepID=A0ABQ9IBV4_9NEOP|nr:hypothetical protein PR048_006772 [Dryococelus australis]
MARRRNEKAWKIGESRKTRRPAASSATIPTCGNLGVAPPGIKPISPRRCSPPTEGSLADIRTGNRAGRCHRSAGFLGDLPFPLPFQSGAVPYPPRFTLIGSLCVDVKNRSHLSIPIPYLHAKTLANFPRVCRAPFDQGADNSKPESSHK